MHNYNQPQFYYGPDYSNNNNNKPPSENPYVPLAPVYSHNPAYMTHNMMPNMMPYMMPNVMPNMVYHNDVYNMRPPIIPSQPVYDRYALQHQDLNATMDPLVSYQTKYHNNNYVSANKAPPIQRFENNSLSKDGEILLQTWRGRHFIPFNTWIQIARAQIHVDFFERNNDDSSKIDQAFLCNLMLTFENDQNLRIMSSGYGKSKKDAKKTATEQIVVNLIQTGHINRGLRNKDHITPGRVTDTTSKPLYAADAITDHQVEEIVDDTQKKVNRLIKRMNESLKKNDFEGACQLLSDIMTRKKPDWNEISFIWCFALLSKNLSYVRSVLDLLQYGKVQGHYGDDQILMSGEKDERVKKELIKKYGFMRLKSSNSYDVFDSSAVEVNLPEIKSDAKDGEKATDHETENELVQYPMMRELHKMLTTYDDVLEPKKLTKTEEPASEQDLLLHSLSNFMQQPIYRSPPSEQQTCSEQKIQPILLSNTTANEASNDDPVILDQPLSDNLIIQPQTHSDASNSALKSSTLNELNSNHISEFVQNDKPQLMNDLKFNKEIKDPSVTYMSYKLVEELYNSLLYTGDLNFSIAISEIIHSKVKSNDDDFFSSDASQYYANKKNMIMVELIENMSQSMSNSAIQRSRQSATVKGVIDKVGSCHAYEIFNFTSTETMSVVQSKLVLCNSFEKQDSIQFIAEGDFVVLTSHGSQTDENYTKSQAKDLILIQDSGSDSETDYKPVQPPTIDLDEENIIKTCTPKETKSKDERIEKPLIAFIQEISRDYVVKLHILPSKEQSDSLMQPSRRWKITKLMNKDYPDKCSQILEKVSMRVAMANPLAQLLLLHPEKKSNIAQSLSESPLQLPHKIPPPLSGIDLNSYQEQAIRPAVSQLLTLIQGPPGTGKLFTVFNIVQEWLKQSSLQILVCSLSDEKLDQLHTNLTNRGINSVRVGPGYENVGLSSMSKSKAKKSSHNANNSRNETMKSFIRQAQVVCTTYKGCASSYFDDIPFYRMILLDASQISEIECLIPLSKECKQLVLVGDQKRLAPLSSSLWVQSKGGSISLFEKFVRQGVKFYSLNKQYRMHPSLLAFPNIQFYSHQLSTGTNESQLPVVNGFPWPNPSIRVAFIHVKGQEKIVSSSIQNTQEVEVVLEVLMALLKNGSNPLRNTAIITPYQAQEKRLRNEINLQARKYPQVFGLSIDQAFKTTPYSYINDIDTVDETKGIEKEIVIVSTTRSNTSGELGILRDPKRMSTMLTSAKRGLIVIGDIETLVHDTNWRDWLTWCKANKVLLQVTQQQTNAVNDLE